MKEKLKYSVYFVVLLTMYHIGIYKLNTGNVGDAKTIQVDFFPIKQH